MILCINLFHRGENLGIESIRCSEQKCNFPEEERLNEVNLNQFSKSLSIFLNTFNLEITDASKHGDLSIKFLFSLNPGDQVKELIFRSIIFFLL